MARNTITKEALASALKNLVNCKAFGKITIKDITASCQISRNTFYYHFTDKYDLLNWIFSTEVLNPVNALVKAGLWGESFAELCRRLQKDRNFYLRVFRYTGESSLQEYLISFYAGLLEDYVRYACQRTGRSLCEQDLHLIARMQAHSYVGIVMDWICADMDEGCGRRLRQLERLVRRTAEYAEDPRVQPLTGVKKVSA